MDINELEKRLTELSTSFLAIDKSHVLSFQGPIAAKWNKNWQLVSPTSADPFALLLVMDNPEPVKIKDLDLVLMTLARHIDKSANCVRSFQAAFQGEKNYGSSISAYLLGVKLRKLFHS